MSESMHEAQDVASGPRAETPGPLDRGSLERWLTSISEQLSHGLLAISESEDWAMDEAVPHFMDGLQSFAGFLQREARTRRPIVDQGDEFNALVTVLAWTRADRALRLLNLIGTRQRGFGGELIAACQAIIEDPAGNGLIQAEAQAVQGRITTLIRQNGFERIFGRERRLKVLQLIEKMKGEPTNENG